MRVYLHWNDDYVVQVVEKDGKVDVSISPFSGVEEALLHACDTLGVGELHGTNPPFGVLDKWREIVLINEPTHRNPAVFYLTYVTAKAEHNSLQEKVVIRGNKALVGNNQVTLPTLECTCKQRFALKPCEHVVAVAHTIPQHEFITWLERFILGESNAKGEYPMEKEKPQVISARYWDCSRLGCYLQRRRPPLEIIEDRIKSMRGTHPAFFNLDGIACWKDTIIAIEWKVTKDYPKAQQNLFKDLSKRGAIVFVVYGNPQYLDVEEVQIYRDGEVSDWKPISNLYEFIDFIIQTVEGKEQE